jgi:predicted transcriptional regulator
MSFRRRVESRPTREDASSRGNLPGNLKYIVYIINELLRRPQTKNKSIESIESLLKRLQQEAGRLQQEAGSESIGEQTLPHLSEKSIEELLSELQTQFRLAIDSALEQNQRKIVNQLTTLFNRLKKIFPDLRLSQIEK